MNDREKLIELLHVSVCNYDCEECKYSISDDVCINHLEEMAADNLLANGVTLKRWISVSDQLPTREDANEIELVLAINKQEGHVREWFWDVVAEHPETFSYWMPLPELPKEE